MRIDTTEKAIELFDYSDGKLYWKIRANSRSAIGQEAGTPDNLGYVRIGYKGTKYLAHRLIWLWHGNHVDEKFEVK